MKIKPNYISSFIPICSGLLLLLSSCKTDTEKRMEASSKAINRFEQLDKSTVDVYPQFTDCDEMDTTASCFYENLHEMIRNKLMADTLAMEISKKDSLIAQFTVDKKGLITYDSIYRCAQNLDRKFLDSVLGVKLKNLPNIDSALKQGTPVSSSYLVPVVIHPMEKLIDQ